MQIKKELLKREVAGDYFLVPVGKTVYDLNGLLAMNEVAAFIWDLLPDANTEEDILQAVLNAYETDSETAKADIEEFLGKLRELKIL